jgi:Tfp pilus assembly protein PilO
MEIDRPTAIAIILFVVLVLILYLVIPKFKEFKTVQTELGNIQTEFDAKYAYYAEVNRVYRELENYKDSLDKVETAIPAKASFGPIIYFFQKKSAENGLIIKGLFLTKVSLQNPESDIKEIVFSLDLLGNYRALKNFLYSLEKSARLFEVTNISFASQIPSVGPLQIPTQQAYSFKLEVKAHSY